MNVLKLMALIAVPLCIGSAAFAAENEGAASLTRAEVIADLQIWQASGMAELHAGEELAWFKNGYNAAAGRYTAQRASPAFALLVKRIAQERGEVVTIAGAK
jgi:hypothetical protein